MDCNHCSHYDKNEKEGFRCKSDIKSMMSQACLMKHMCIMLGEILVRIRHLDNDDNSNLPKGLDDLEDKKWMI